MNRKKKNPPHYECSDCDKIFNNLRYYTRHTDGHKNNNCKHCDEKFTQRKHLKNHLLHVHNIRESACFQCPKCDQKYVKSITLIMHIANKHAEGKRSCIECAAMFDNEDEYNTHIAEHDKQKPFTCNRCGYKFHRKQQYLIHLKQHDKYECITCNEKYADKRRLLAHKRMGHKVQGIEPKFKCDLCSKRLSRKLLLDIHLQKHKSTDSDNHINSFDCDEYIYTQINENQSNSTDSNGLVITNEEKKYYCELCKKDFTNKSKLNQHIERIHNDAGYNCNLCSHKSNNKTNLMQHVRSHLTVDKKIVCDQCGKSFYKNGTFKEHQNIVHSEVAGYSCNICGMAFKRNSDITRHLQTHSNIRPHVCIVCGQAYKRKTHLQRHQLSLHGVKTTISKKHLVPKLIKNNDGNLILLENVANTNLKQSQANLDTTALFNSLVEIKIEPINQNELWIDKPITIIEDYSEMSQTFNTTNTSSDFLSLNSNAVHLDHIDTKDLIILSTDQMLSVESVVENLETFQYL